MNWVWRGSYIVLDSSKGGASIRSVYLIIDKFRVVGGHGRHSFAEPAETADTSSNSFLRNSFPSLLDDLLSEVAFRLDPC